MRWFVGAGMVAALAGCAKSSTGPEFLWKVTVIGAQDNCNNPPVDYTGQKQFDYDLAFDNSKVTLSLDTQVFAIGTISGCDIVYDTVTWDDPRKDGTDLKWQLHGEATYRQDQTSCNLDQGVDWKGTETFTIEGSTDTNIKPGCTYVLTEEGTYGGQVK